VVAGVLYGVARMLGRYDERFNIGNLKAEIEAQLAGTQSEHPVLKDVGTLMFAAGKATADTLNARMDAMADMAQSGRWWNLSASGDIFDKRMLGKRPLNQHILGLLGENHRMGASGLMGEITGTIPQSRRGAALQQMWSTIEKDATKQLRTLGLSLGGPIGLYWEMTQKALAGGKPVNKDVEARAKEALDILEETTRKVAVGLQEAAQRIREARVDRIDDDLKAVGDMMQAIDAELVPKSALAGLRNRRDQLAVERIGLQMQSGNDLDAQAARRELNLTHLRERRSDAQDLIDAMKTELGLQQGDYSLREDARKLSNKDAAGLKADLPGIFGKGGPNVAGMMGQGASIAKAMRDIGDVEGARQFEQEMARWRMGLAKDKGKSSPSIAREILSTGGVSGLTEASISQVVSGGYLGARQNGVFGPYRLSGAAASRVRASVSQENEKHVRIDMYLHPDAGAMDDLANAATTQVIQYLPRAFRGEGFKLQMTP
jgi:hypothetical protein